MGNNNMGKLAIVFKEKWNRFSHYLRNILQNDIACLCITPSLYRRLNIQLVRSQCERGSFSSLFSWSSERQTYFRTKFIYKLFMLSVSSQKMAID